MTKLLRKSKIIEILRSNNPDFIVDGSSSFQLELEDLEFALEQLAKHPYKTNVVLGVIPDKFFNNLLSLIRESSDIKQLSFISYLTADQDILDQGRNIQNQCDLSITQDRCTGDSGHPAQKLAQ